MSPKTWPLLLLLCASTIGCDAIPSVQFDLQTGIQRDLKVARAIVMVFDTSHMVVGIADPDRARLEPKARAAFLESVATYAVTHYRRGRLTSVAVAIDGPRAPRAPRAPRSESPDPIFFMPEYHPDGTVRVALLPQPARAVPARRKS